VNDRLSRGESVIGFENRCQCQDGSYKWLSWSSYPDLEKQRIFSAVRDISERKKLEDELLKLATTDPLTGASNRRHFITRASAELERCRRYGSQLAVFMLDIDHFKQVNDSYGHDIGDEVLQRLADCCHQELRSNDIFGRFGGEEFAAVLVETDQPQAERACQRLLDKIVALKIRTPQKNIGITVSMGLTMHIANDLTIDSLLKRADDALYQAKNAGRNQIAVI
jgi:diguanylate cyclase (GGDEF)-like protein